MFCWAFRELTLKRGGPGEVSCKNWDFWNLLKIGRHGKAAPHSYLASFSQSSGRFLFLDGLKPTSSPHSPPSSLHSFPVVCLDWLGIWVCEPSMRVCNYSPKPCNSHELQKRKQRWFQWLLGGFTDQLLTASSRTHSGDITWNSNSCFSKMKNSFIGVALIFLKPHILHVWQECFVYYKKC